MPCTLDTLQLACQFVYFKSANFHTVKSNDNKTEKLVFGGIKSKKSNRNRDTKDRDEMNTIKKRIEKNGYKIHTAKGTRSHHSRFEFPVESKSGLGYAILLPEENPKDPIIIAFRGTNKKGDLGEDIKLGVSGVGTENYRNEAWNVYQYVQKNLVKKGQQVVITGHSLGGHLATYAGVKASSKTYNNEENIHVRTFNGAGLFTTHKKNMVSFGKEVEAPNFVHYRLYNDQVGKLKTIGNKIVFIGEKQRRFSGVTPHFMKSVEQDLPQNMKNIIVGGSPLNKMEEVLIGLSSTYGCRRKSQYDGLRTNVKIGKKKFILIEEAKNSCLKLLKNNDIPPLSCLSQVRLELNKYMEKIERIENSKFSEFFHFKSEGKAIEMLKDAVNRCSLFIYEEQTKKEEHEKSDEDEKPVEIEMKVFKSNN